MKIFKLYHKRKRTLYNDVSAQGDPCGSWVTLREINSFYVENTLTNAYFCVYPLSTSIQCDCYLFLY